jgi:RNA polymerase sigma factor (sigma-70 family)
VTDTRIEDLLRPLAPQVLGALVRHYGHFDTAEDATQEALIAAATQWPDKGIPDTPKAWLIRVASRKLTDLLRSDQARAYREFTFAAQSSTAPPVRDDSLILLFMCCHPSLNAAAQIALTLRAVGGLSTGEIARAFLVPEDTMTRRITRAKQRIRDSGVPFALPAPAEHAERLAAVLRVLYLIFTEGYASTRADLATEAIRLARLAHSALPAALSADGETTGLLALMLLTDARRLARTGPAGEPVPLAEQDRARWNAAFIAEGVALVTAALRAGRPGPYQLQAAIAALYDEAPTAADTDWPQIAALYELLLQADPDNPVVRLNRAVAVAMADGPGDGLALLGDLEADQRIASGHRFHAARAHLLEMAGDRDAARAAYTEAARRAPSLPQQRYLIRRRDSLLSHNGLWYHASVTT